MKRRRRKHDIGKEYNRPAPAGSDTGEWEGFVGCLSFLRQYNSSLSAKQSFK